MQDNMNEKISRFIDNDLSLEQIQQLQSEMNEDDLLKQKMMRYQMLSQALKSSEVVQLKADFSSQITQQLEQEPVFFKRRNKPYFNWQTTSLAVAASLAIVAVMSPAIIKQTAPNMQETPLVAQQQVTSQASSYSLSQPLPPAGRLVRVQNHPTNQRFNDYLQIHSNSMYTIGQRSHRPTARVAGFSEGN